MGMWTIPKSSDDEEISDDEIRKFLREISQEAVRRGLSAPMVFGLELGKPVSFVGAQLLAISKPFMSGIFNESSLSRWQLVLSHREYLEFLASEMELIERESQGKT